MKVQLHEWIEWNATAMVRPGTGRQIILDMELPKNEYVITRLKIDPNENVTLDDLSKMWLYLDVGDLRREYAMLAYDRPINRRFWNAKEMRTEEVENLPSLETSLLVKNEYLSVSAFGKGEIAGAYAKAIYITLAGLKNVASSTSVEIPER